MRILLTNNHLNTFGGSETFTVTLYNALKRLKHDVDVFTFHPSLRGEKGGGAQGWIEDLKWVGSSYNNAPTGRYDLVICNHNSCFEYVSNNVLFDEIYFISHGTVPRLEQPPQGANQYFAVSEEVQNHMLKNYGVHSMVIRNPIDLDLFHPYKKIKLEKALCISQGIKARENILKLPYEVNYTEISRFKRKLLTNYDFNIAGLVFSLGRGAYESLACGRPTIIYDSRDYNGDLYDGLITQENINTLLRNNCSGRTFKGRWDITRVQNDISKISYDMDYYRAIAEENFDYIKIAKFLTRE